MKASERKLRELQAIADDVYEAVTTATKSSP